MLNNIKILDTERIVNEGVICYQCNYYTIYYHQGVQCVGLYNVTHGSYYNTEDEQPSTFADNKLIVVDTVEEFYKKCINNEIDQGIEVKQSYINWFEKNFYDVEKFNIWFKKSH